MTPEPTPPPAPAWPRIATLKNGSLSVIFSSPSAPHAEVDWLLVRDWLKAEARAAFTAAFEYPTFEWYAKCTITTRAGHGRATLWWSDWPEYETFLKAHTPEDNPHIQEIAERLRTTRPEFGLLKTMNGRAWQEWMISLGSTDYGKDA